MATLWLVRRDEKTTAPLTTSQLKQCVRNGQVRPDDMIAKAGTEKWHRAESVKGLFTPTDVKASHGGEIIQVVPPAAVPVPTEQKPPNAETGEHTIWEGRPSQISNAKTFILCVLFAWLVIPVFVAIKRWLDVRSIHYTVTNQRLKVSWGFLAQEVHEWELYRIKDTSFRQSLFERLVGLGTIAITSSDRSHPHVRLVAIPASRAKTLREEIRSLTEQLREKKGIREIDHV